MGWEICTDNRFEIIAAYKKKLIEGTNIESSPDEMAVIDNILFRFWQMNWLPAIPHGRLGDLDRLEQMFADIDNAPYSGFDGTEPFYSAEDAAQIIRLATTVIPASEGGE